MYVFMYMHIYYYSKNFSNYYILIDVIKLVYLVIVIINSRLNED